MNLQKEWVKITKEVHGKPKCEVPYPLKVMRTRELLLIAQVVLGQIELGQNVLFNRQLYRKIMSGYYAKTIF